MQTNQQQSKIRLGLDLDGVIYDFVDEFHDYIAEVKGWNPDDLKSPTHWSFYRDWGMTDEEYYFELGKAAINSKVFLNGKIYDQALENILKLKEMGFEIVIITARQLSNNPDHMQIIRKNTETWLENNNVPFDELVIDNDKTRHSLNILIDDNLSNVEAMAINGNDGYVFDRPWNRETNLFPRVMGWPDLVREMEIVQERLMNEYYAFVSSQSRS